MAEWPSPRRDSQFKGVFESDTGQGRLFMTPREIMESARPWDGDRKYVVSGITTHGADEYGIYSGMDASNAQWGMPDPWQTTNGGLKDEAGPYGVHVARSVGQETNDQLWDRKLDEADDSGLTDAIEEEGVRDPIPISETLGSPYLTNGHHRVAAAFHLNPDQLVPVQGVRHFGDPVGRKGLGPVSQDWSGVMKGLQPLRREKSVHEELSRRARQDIWGV